MSDVLKHFIAGTIISSIVCTIVLFILGTDKVATDWAIGLSFFSALLAGLIKEYWDKTHKGTVEAIDVVATWSGGAVPMIVWGIIQNYI